MKHNLKITLLLLGMFILTQFIGLAVQNADIFHVQNIDATTGNVTSQGNPYMTWIAPPEPQTQTDSLGLFSQLIFSFIIAILLIFFLSKFKVEFFLKAWFFLVITIALLLCFYSFFRLSGIQLNELYVILSLLAVALVLAYFKVYRRSFILHNLTELLIYPGIATVFVPILNVYTIIALLVLISIYDAWAVWHTGFMQKMAKYQINKLNIFSGFFVPYVSKAMKNKINLMKEKYSKKELSKKKIKVNIAILGGGDVVFPIIASGIMFKYHGFWPATFVILGATAGLAYLFFFAEKKKFYPAMPFITSGIFLGMIAGYLLF